MEQLKCLVFATHNANKREEVSKINGAFADYNLIDLQTLEFDAEIKETGSTLKENAFIKANTIYKKYNYPVFGEDTGLEVSTLNDAPGTYTARYAGEHKSDEENMLLLLKNLSNTFNRYAQFRTVLCYIDKNEIRYFEGICKGQIAFRKLGVDGFGYDPIFIPDGYTRSFAEMHLSQKNKISHRKKAISRLSYFLAQKNI